MFFRFVESESNPKTDPVVLWAGASWGFVQNLIFMIYNCCDKRSCMDVACSMLLVDLLSGMPRY